MSSREGVPRWLAQAAALSWRFLVVVAGGSVLVIVVIRLRLLFLPVFVALLFATVLAPPANRLIARRWPPLLATFVVLGLCLAILIGAIAWLAPQVAGEFGDLGQTVKAGSEEALTWLTEGPLDLSHQQIDEFVNRAGEALRKNIGGIAGGAVAGTVLIAEIITGAALTFVLLFFFIKDGPVISGWLLGLLSPTHRELASRMGKRAWEALSGYVRGTAIVAFVDAAIIGIGLLIIGVPLVVPLMLLTFVGGFFPLVGAVLAGAVAALVALVTNGLVDALLVVAVVVVVQQVEGDVLQPVVMGRAVKLHPLAVLLGVSAGGFLGGITGAFVAVPLIAVAVAASGEIHERGRAMEEAT